MGKLGKRLLLLLCCFAILILAAGLFAWLSDRGLDTSVEILGGILSFVFIGILIYAKNIKK